MSNKRSILKSDRVELVLTEEEHLEKRVAYINDPELQKTLNFDYPTSLSKTRKWFNKTLLDNTRVDFSILDQKNKEMIGFCGFLNIEVPVMKAEVYIAIGNKDYWGKGYGREANKLLHNYGFIERGFNRIYSYHLAHNERMRKNSEALGKKIEAHFRESIYSHGELKDQYLAAILRSEWENNEAYDI
ncbi:MAG TPA: GNAT family protein [Fodinibius sp.]|nr:GNAT family protein [Fodinibius sp.]